METLNEILLHKPSLNFWCSLPRSSSCFYFFLGEYASFTPNLMYCELHSYGFPSNSFVRFLLLVHLHDLSSRSSMSNRKRIPFVLDDIHTISDVEIVIINLIEIWLYGDHSYFKLCTLGHNYIAPLCICSFSSL